MILKFNGYKGNGKPCWLNGYFTEGKNYNAHIVSDTAIRVIDDQVGVVLLNRDLKSFYLDFSIAEK